MLNIEKEPLAAALQRALPGLEAKHAMYYAAEVIASTDYRLEQNVLEWIQNQPISDIWVDKYCINAIMAIRGDGDFLDALEAMNLYLQDPRLGEMRIWRARK